MQELEHPSAAAAPVEYVHARSFASATPAAFFAVVPIAAVQVTGAGIGPATSDCAGLVGDSVTRPKVALRVAGS